MREIERIKECYQRRRQLPKDLYSYFNPGNLFIVQQRERKLLELLQKHGMNSLEDKKILDVGCGGGGWLRDFLKWGARPENLFGIELLEDRVRQAKRLSPHLCILQGNGEELPFLDRVFHIVIQSTVFTSIFNAGMKHRIAQEMLRVLKDGGLILWYDFCYDNPRNPDVRGIGKREIIKLFPNCRFDFHRVTLLPFLSRALAPKSWLLCYLFERLVLFNTHYLVVIRS